MFISKKSMIAAISHARKDSHLKGFRDGFSDALEMIPLDSKKAVADLLVAERIIASLMRERDELTMDRNAVQIKFNNLKALHKLHLNASYAKIKLGVNTDFGDMVSSEFLKNSSQILNTPSQILITPSPILITPSPSYHVVRVTGGDKMRTPISCDLAITEAIALCNESNNDYADNRTHYEIEVH